MKIRFIYLLVFVLSSVTLFSQSLKLQNIEKDTKFKYLGKSNYLEIKLNETGDNVFINKTYYGFFNQKIENKYEFNVDYEYIEEVSDDKAPIVLVTKELFDTSFVKSFTSEEIGYIINHKKSESIFNNLAELSLLGALLSPLFCIDYKNLEINSENYFILAGGFLGTALVSYTVSFTFGKKKFYLHPNSFEKDKKVWKLK